MKHINFRTLKDTSIYLTVLRSKCLSFIRSSLWLRAYLGKLVGYLLINTAIVLVLQPSTWTGINNELFVLFLLTFGFQILDKLINPVMKFGGYLLITAGIAFVVFFLQGIGTGFNNALFVVLFLSIAFSIIDWLINPVFQGNKTIWISGSLVMTNLIILCYVLFIVNGVHEKNLMDEDGYFQKKMVLENLRNNYFYLAAQEEFGAWNNAEIKGSRCGAICSEYKAKSNAINRRIALLDATKTETQ